MSHRPLLPKNVKPRHGMNPFSQSYCPHSSTRWSHQTSSKSTGLTRTLSAALKRASNTLSVARSSSNMEYTQLCLSLQPKVVPKASKRRPSLARSVTSTLQGFFDVEEQPIVVSDQPRSLFDRCSSVAGLYGVKKTKQIRNFREEDWDFRCRGEESGVIPCDGNECELLYESGSFWISSFKSSEKSDFISASKYQLRSYTPHLSPKNSYSDEQGCLMRPIR